MKLKDLKQGMVCELRNKETITMVSNVGDYAQTGYTKTLNLYIDYKDDLTHRVLDREDILKVSFGNETIFDKSKKLIFEPEKGGRYYFININEIEEERNDSYMDDELFESQLVFETYKEAEKELLKQQARIRVMKEIQRLNEGWFPNWEDDRETKYYVGYDTENKKLFYHYFYNFKTIDNTLYLKTRELAEQLIKTHEVDLKLMLEVEYK